MNPNSVLFCAVLTFPAFCGELRLFNGDILHGDVKEITADSLVFASPVFGEIKIPKSVIVDLENDVAFDLVIDGGDIHRACHLNVVESVVHTDCVFNEGVVTLSEFSTVKSKKMLSGKLFLEYSREKDTKIDEESEADLTLRIESGSFAQNVDIEFESKKTNNIKTQEDYRLEYQLDYYLTQKWYPYGRVEYYSDRFNSIDNWLVGSVGVGYQLWASPRGKIGVEIGGGGGKYELRMAKAPLLPGGSTVGIRLSLGK